MEERFLERRSQVLMGLWEGGDETREFWGGSCASFPPLVLLEARQSSNSTQASRLSTS